MSATDFDLLVVGASFGGAACAIAAASAGLRVCVLERKRDPGERLHTTGIVVREAAEQTLLGQAPAHCLRRVERVRLYSPSLRDVALAAPGYYFLTTDTPELMRWLADQVSAHGAQLRLGTSFTAAERDGDGWQVAGVGKVRWLVGADGARSRVAQRAGLGQVRDFLYGIEHEYAACNCPNRTRCTASSAAATRPATSAGSRRTRPACRPGWPCATIPHVRACRTSTASWPASPTGLACHRAAGPMRCAPA